MSSGLVSIYIYTALYAEILQRGVLGIFKKRGGRICKQHQGEHWKKISLVISQNHTM